MRIIDIWHCIWLELECWNVLLVCKWIFHDLIFLMNSALKFQYLISMCIFNCHPLILQHIAPSWLTCKPSMCVRGSTRLWNIEWLTHQAFKEEMCGFSLSRSLALSAAPPPLFCRFHWGSFAVSQLALSSASYHHLLFHTFAAKAAYRRRE